MKITDEMVVRAIDAYYEAGVAGDIVTFRAALEAALADVPEPSAWQRAALGQHGADKDRIAALDAKLAEVRVCVQEWRNGNQAAAVMPRIADILDEEP